MLGTIVCRGIHLIFALIEVRHSSVAKPSTRNGLEVRYRTKRVISKTVKLPKKLDVTAKLLQDFHSFDAGLTASRILTANQLVMHVRVCKTTTIS